MRILLLEDKPDTLYSIAQELKQHYFVHMCSSITKAKESIANNLAQDDITKKIDTIVTDLNMSYAGLTPKEQEMTHGSKLSGWIWLINYVYIIPENSGIKPVIYSEFISTLEGRISSMVDAYEIEVFKKTECVLKSKEVSGHAPLLAALARISK